MLGDVLHVIVKRGKTAIYACLIAAPSARDVLTHKLVPSIHAPYATYPNALAVIVYLGELFTKSCD